MAGRSVVEGAERETPHGHCTMILAVWPRTTDTEKRIIPMLQLTINGEPHTLPDALTLADLLERLKLDPRRVAVEVNREVVPRKAQPGCQVRSGDAVEITTLAGGGAPEELPADKSLRIGKFEFRSRL